MSVTLATRGVIYIPITVPINTFPDNYTACAIEKSVIQQIDNIQITESAVNISVETNDIRICG